MTKVIRPKLTSVPLFFNFNWSKTKSLSWSCIPGAHLSPLLLHSRLSFFSRTIWLCYDGLCPSASAALSSNTCCRRSASPLLSSPLRCCRVQPSFCPPFSSNSSPCTSSPPFFLFPVHSCHSLDWDTFSSPPPSVPPDVSLCLFGSLLYPPPLLLPSLLISLNLHPHISTRRCHFPLHSTQSVGLPLTGSAHWKRQTSTFKGRFQCSSWLPWGWCHQNSPQFC